MLNQGGKQPHTLVKQLSLVLKIVKEFSPEGNNSPLMKQRPSSAGHSFYAEKCIFRR